MGARNQTATVDVVVAGTGAAGLTAALAAGARGARVRLLDKSPLVGGTTAVSMGQVWIPMNHHMPSIGVDDDRDAALRYLDEVTRGTTAPLLESFVDTAEEVLSWLEQHTPLEFSAPPPTAPYGQDYHPEFPGAKPAGRTLDPGLFELRQLGSWAERLRLGIVGPVASRLELAEWRAWCRPDNVPSQLVRQRVRAGFVAYGTSLAGGLLAGCLNTGIEPSVNTSVTRLLWDGGSVTGVVTEGTAGKQVIRATGGVVLATGGFERNHTLLEAFIGRPITHPTGSPTSTGDGLILALSAGAALGAMHETWWTPAVDLGEHMDGEAIARMSIAERQLPHSLVVNGAGKRFVNEAVNYNDFSNALATVNPVTLRHENLPAWLLIDTQFRDRYALHTWQPGEAAPEWLVSAPSLEDLAGLLEVPAGALCRTVERFNRFAGTGSDEDFGRGTSEYDRRWGDPEHGPNACLGTLEAAPFYAVRLHPGTLGTRGGPVTSANGEVRSATGEVIPGLYAAGAVAAAVVPTGYPGPGATLGPALTFGYRAGVASAARSSQVVG